MANGSLSLALSGYCLESSNRWLISATSSHFDVWDLFMAREKKKKGMVLHQEGEPTSATAPAGNHPSACLVVPKLGEASEGEMERSTHVTSEEADGIEANMYPSKEGVGTPAVKYPTSLNPHPDNLSPDIICKGIRVTLDNNSMWNEFFRCKTEMILTKQGSRMFPYCRFRISGLQPSKKYCLVMDIQPLDNSRYKWTGKSWQVAGKAEGQVKSKPFAHPESPSAGQHWMQNPVSFYKLKLTNNISEQEGNTILHPMHRYSPRLHVVQTDKAAKDIKLNAPCVVTFSFPQTEFMAVTAYQNSRFAQLKVDYNPFAKGLKEDGSSSLGLKLKLNSGKDLNKAGGTTTTEHRPVKESLKCLLANHKPRSSKAMDSKLPVSSDLQNSTTSGDRSAAQAPEESLCSSQPSQKLFSELIREAHVSLQRCNLDQLDTNHSTCQRAELTNTKTTALESKREDVSKKDQTPSETLCVKNCETGLLSKRKFKQDRHNLNLHHCKDNASSDYSEVTKVVTVPVVSQKTSVDSNHKPTPSFPSEVNIKQHKRPAPLPLPALALFLKQHLTKSKKSKNSPGPTPPVLSSKSQTSAEDSTCVLPDHASNANVPLKDLTGNITKFNNHASGQAIADIHPPGKAVKAAFQSSSPSCLDAVGNVEPREPRADGHLASISVFENPGSNMAVPDDSPVQPNSDKQMCTHGTFSSSICSTLATSSASPVLSPPLDTMLIALNSPQTPPFTECSTLPSDSPTIKADSLLPDPECSPFGFKPLSAATSPEPLAPLPASLAFDLNSTTSETTLRAAPPEELSLNVYSTPTLLKWHTVLPTHEPYIDPSYTTFQSTSQPLSLGSISSPLLPSSTPTHTEPQTLETSTSMALDDPTLSFQQNEQLLPFPGELSPLALQLPLSPTFYSLDGDGLSPTPSIADLVHFFSNDDDLGMGVEFSNSEAVAATCPPPTIVEAIAHEPSQILQPCPAKKPCKSKKRSCQRKLADMDMDQKADNATYTSMKPNLEEVEEQLFISFTSKEALKLHIADSPEETATQPSHNQTTPEGHLPPPANTTENGDNLLTILLQSVNDDGTTCRSPAESLEKISSCEKILLTDLKMMKHKQVIHPVLQEVGLKMNLLDPSLAIDLQYLGVYLPISPGASQEPVTLELPPSQAFVSRTGKTTDITQIKGWREKFTASEAPPTPSSATPEAGPSSDPPKKNLSAFCSDMLDEYLENEGKLIDERAASFSQPVVGPVVYELPARSTSYVRTLDSVLKKHTASSPTSDLISGFIPPSKRSKPSLKETKTSSKERKHKGPKMIKLRPEPAAASVSTPEPSPAEPNLDPKQPPVPTSAAPPLSEPTTAVTEPHKSKKHQKRKLSFNRSELSTLSPRTPTSTRRRKLKPKSLCQTLSPPGTTAHLPHVSEDLAPLESDSELGAGADQGNEDSRPVMTRALFRQKDLEDGVVWEGRPRTSITIERAAIALTSLFTLMGFVRENPTAPVQLVRRRVPPCLNDFCRLGCICSSLSHCSRISHCGRPCCMFGCSCLKQKVVLLKNLDGSDSSPSPKGKRRRRRRRRMKMAYILKEADSVSQPAERVRILWRKDARDSDPDPTSVPDFASVLRSSESSDNSSCARVRGYIGKRKSWKQTDTKKIMKPKSVQLKDVKQRDLPLMEAKTSAPSPPAAAQPVSPVRPQSPPPEPAPKPSKRLIIIAECKWAIDTDRNYVLKRLCEAMAQDRLDQPFWLQKYFIRPTSQNVEESGRGCCTQYIVHITRPTEDGEKPAAPPKPLRLGNQRTDKPQLQEESHLRQVSGGAEHLEAWQWEITEEEKPPEDWQQELEEGEVQEAKPPEDWQQEITEEEKPPEDWQQEITEEEKPPEDWQQEITEEEKPPEDWQQEITEEEKPPEDWQQEITEEEKPPEDWQQEIREEEKPPEDWQQELEEGEVQEEKGSTLMDNWSKRSGGGTKRKEKKEMVSLALPFLTGISPAGFLSARRRQPGGADHLVQVNGKLYPLAKIQLGKMGALHPANRLAAYLTGRVGSSRKQLGSSSSSSQSSKPPQTQSSDPTPPTNLLASSNIIAADYTPPQTQPSITAATAPPSSTVLDQSAGAPEGARAGAVAVRLNQNPAAGAVSVSPVASGPGVKGLLPIGQRMVLQHVHTAADGRQYYRLPDGKLVQLLPISKPRAVTTAPLVPRGCAPPSFLPPATDLPVEIQPQTSLLSSPSPLSGLRSFSGPPCPTPLGPGTGFLSQKTKCTFKILPTNSKKEKIFISCPELPTRVVTTPSTSLQSSSHPPAPLLSPLSLKLSKGQGVELNSKTVKVSADSVIAGGLSAFQKPTTSQTSTISLTPPPASGSEVTPLPPSHPIAEPELASDLVDLDIICVDNEMGLITTETSEVVDLAGSSSGETENSSDFGDEDNQRKVHNLLERRRRVKMRQMFRVLRKEVGLTDDRTSKISTLNKAEQLIQELRWTEAHLTEKKRRLMKRRDRFLSTIAPTGNNIDNDIIFISSNVQLPTLPVPPTTAQSSTKPVPLPAPAPVPVQTPVPVPLPVAASVQTPVPVPVPLPVAASVQIPVPVQTPVPVPVPLPVAASVQTPVPVPVSVPVPVPVPAPVQMSQRILQVSQSRLASLAVSHIPVVQHRPKTIPNILSHSKRPVPSSSLLPTVEAPSLQVLVPADVLSRIGAALPGQQILTLNPMTALQTTATAPESRTFSEASNRLHLPQPPQGVSAGPVLPSDQILDQAPSSSSTLCPGLSVDCGAEFGSLGVGPKTRADGGTESPTSLNEIVSVNQRTVSTAGVSYEVDHAVGGAKEQGHTHSLGLDSDNSAAIETEQGSLQGHTEMTQTGPQTGPTDGNNTGNALAPPPLLQRKVGGAKVFDPASSDRATAGERREEGVTAWRPMPRLVPLGLRGNPPS
ncbi:MAX dimerization protein MGA a isoform X2 [Platichthys flesus]|uniref:MAX dimerization protein MGA a isoform X2 n=1 Tax=Platichthys flesus TaxID=8260 RepID=UPI002DBA6F74|nr:MAX dimerization protein MGA a isoform X2 [Platichthys flesus]